MAQLKDLLVNGKSKFLDMVTAVGMKLSTGGSDSTVWNTNGGVVDLKTKGYVHAGATKTTDTRGHWNADISGITSLYDGLTIHIKLSTAYYGNGEDYNTLNVNGLGPKLVWFRYNSRATSHWSTNAELRLTYRTTAGSYTVTTTTGELVNGTTYTDGWIAEYAYYDNSVGYVHYNYASIKVGDTAISPYNPIGIDKNGLLVPMLSKPFLVSGPMYLYSGSLSANYTGSWVGLCYSHYSYQIRNGSSYVEGVAYKPLYLKGTISGGMFTADSTTPYATALPSTDDGFCYYYLGETTTSTASSKYTYISFRTGVHPVYYYKDAALRLYSSDFRVSQIVASSGSGNYRPVLVGKSSSSSGTPTFSNLEDSTYSLAKIIAKPDTGDLHLYNTSGDSPKLFFNSGSMTAGGNMYYDSTEECMKFSFS